MKKNTIPGLVIFQLDAALSEIHDILGNAFQVTLIARYDGSKPLNDADIILSSDDLQKVIKTLARKLD